MTVEFVDIERFSEERLVEEKLLEETLLERFKDVFVTISVEFIAGFMLVEFGGEVVGWRQHPINKKIPITKLT